MTGVQTCALPICIQSALDNPKEQEVLRGFLALSGLHYRDGDYAQALRLAAIARQHLPDLNSHTGEMDTTTTWEALKAQLPEAVIAQAIAEAAETDSTAIQALAAQIVKAVPD